MGECVKVHKIKLTNMTFFESPRQWFSALSDTTLSLKKKLLLEVKSMDNIAYLPHKNQYNVNCNADEK